ncbi:MAG: Transposase family protein [Gemmataceae bacterium]|nr:Transposase family protein [Gemmataceae bacterium]
MRLLLSKGERHDGRASRPTPAGPTTRLSADQRLVATVCHPWACGGVVQWPTLGVYLTDGRLMIDNSAAEQAIRPLAVGRRNWLHLGGDGGLKPTAVLLSICASIKRQGINPWVYLKHVLTELPTRPPSADLTDLLPDAWARSLAGLVAVPA